MALLLDALLEAVRKPTVGEAAAELAALAAPLWIAVILGLFIGWAWRPRWAAGLAAAAEPSAPPPPPTCGCPAVPGQTTSLVAEPASVRENLSVVGDEDLRHLIQLVEVIDGGPAWRKMIERELPMMSYQAWQRDPPSGPPQYRSSTVFEDATPEIVRDFFWDDEFRTKNGWDDMLLQHTTLESCPTTGTMVVQWLRKFPFFCSNREYIIGRRIWESNGTFYCVTKGVPCPSIPRRNKPRRVDLYYSSWCIRPVASKLVGRMTACEVLLFHHEDMGIPWEIAKLGVKQGMWGCVKRIEPGLRAYQIAIKSEVPFNSPGSAMAQITTKFDAGKLRSLEENPCSSTGITEIEKQKHWTSNLPKFLIVGGAVALACSLDQGLLTKAVIFGVARRFSRQGKKL